MFANFNRLIIWKLSESTRKLVILLGFQNWKSIMARIYPPLDSPPAISQNIAMPALERMSASSFLHNLLTGF